MDHAGGQAPQSLAPEGFGQLRRDETHLAHLTHQLPLEHARSVTFLETWGDAICGESAHVIAERDQVFVKIGVHHLSPGKAAPQRASERARLKGLGMDRRGAYFAYLRKSGLRFSLSALTPSRDSSVS